MNPKLKISFYVAAIFIAGIVTGVFISCLVVRHMMPSREKITDGWSNELKMKLDLTPQQVEKIRPIIDRTMTEFTGKLSLQMLSSLSNCNAQIALELAPEQKAKLERLQSEKEKFIRTHIGAESSGAKKSP